MTPRFSAVLFDLDGTIVDSAPGITSSLEHTLEQLTRYLELMNRDPRLAPVTGIFAAQEIKPQARTLAEDRGIRCVVLDYDAMRGIESGHARLF